MVKEALEPFCFSSFPRKIRKRKSIKENLVIEDLPDFVYFVIKCKCTEHYYVTRVEEALKMKRKARLHEFQKFKIEVIY